MFEKDAEELFRKKPLGYETKPELEIYTDGFNDGYNKANEWRDFPEEQAIARKGFKAGAEHVLKLYESGWHNIKDNPEDLPTEDGQYLIYEIQYGDPWYTVAYFVTCANEFGTGHKNVIAWRELPKYEG